MLFISLISSGSSVPVCGVLLLVLLLKAPLLLLLSVMFSVLLLVVVFLGFNRGDDDDVSGTWMGGHGVPKACTSVTPNGSVRKKSSA